MSFISKFNEFYQQLNEKDLTGLADIYSENIEFIDPLGKHIGLKNLQQYFANLFENTRWCEFTIHHAYKLEALDNDNPETDKTQYTIEWTMKFSSLKLSEKKVISVDGTTFITCLNEKCTYHRDYFDVGQLVYENIPVLGYFVRKIKKQIK